MPRMGMHGSALVAIEDEHAALAKGQLSKSLLKRIARFHLIDNTRGEPPMWKDNEIKKLKGTLQGKNGNSQLRATVHLQSADNKRAFEAELFGHIETRNGKVTRLDLVGAARTQG